MFLILFKIYQVSYEFFRYKSCLYTLLTNFYSKILFKENNFSECIDVLLEIFRKDKEWKDAYAKKQLLLIFDHLGSENELSKKGRRALTSLIFV